MCEEADREAGAKIIPQITQGLQVPRDFGIANDYLEADRCMVADIGSCNCSRLNLAVDVGHSGIGAPIPAPRGVRGLVGEKSAGGFVQAEKLPSDAFIAFTAATDLPNAHNVVSVLGTSDGMNLDNTGESIVTDPKAFA